jgi:hypothetical protein
VADIDIGAFLIAAGNGPEKQDLFSSQPRSYGGNMLGIGSGSFDPETLVILETAFDEAWITLKSNGSANIRPNELARPGRLHDRALGELIPATAWRELS